VGRLGLLALVLAAGLVSGCGKLNLANYNRITPGMTLKDVETILGEGKPLAVEDWGFAAGGAEGGAARSVKARAWRDGDAVLVVLFQDDKVAGKTSSDLGVMAP
jgi:hypothetical protein